MIIGLPASLKGFSQTDTLVKIDRSTAIKVAGDLTRYDSLKVQYRLLEQNIAALKSISVAKDKKLNELADAQGRLNQIISNQNALQQSADLRYKQLEKKYKTAVRMGRFKVVLLIGAAAFGIYKTVK